MANRYRVGGGSSSNRNATGNTNWGTASGVQDNASAPTSADDVFFDGVGTGASNCTISAAANCKSLNFTGYTNTLTHNNSSRLTVSGSLTFSSGMTYTYSTAPDILINATGTFTTAGKQLRGFLTFSTGTITLGDDLTFITGYFSLTSGTFVHNYKTVTVNGVTPDITGNFTFYNLTVVGFNSASNALSLGSNIVVSNDLTINGYSAGTKITVKSNTGGVNRNLYYGGTLSESNVIYTDVTKIYTGGGATNTTNFLNLF